MRLSNFLSNCWQQVPPLWLVALLALALWGGGYVRRGLWEPDEARYAYVAREMQQNGHWFVPHVNGELYPDKPPLIFWMINAASTLTGGRITGVSTRLPSLLGAILALWVVTRLMERWRGTRAAWRALLILPSIFMFWQEGGIDALLCGLVLLSVYFLLSSWEGHRTRREVLAYLCAGLSVFAKGPVGLALPMGLVLVIALASDRRSELKRSHWLWGPVVALTIPGAWLLVAWLQHAPTEYFAAVFGEKSFGRAIQSTNHPRPFYYFFLRFPFEGLPWTIFLPISIAALAKRHRPLLRMLSAWGLFVICFFSLFVCKRNVYILVAYPALAMLVGSAWEDFALLPRRWVTVTGGIAMGMVYLMAVAATTALFIPQLPINRMLLVPSALILLAGSVVLFRLFRRERLGLRWFVAYCGLMLMLQISVATVVFPGLNKLKGPVDAARAVQACVAPDQPIYLYQQQLAIFPLYAERSGRQIESVEALQTILTDHPQVVVVFLEKHWQSLETVLKASRVAHPFKMGKKSLVWVEFTQQPQI